ncbi:MAG: M24 family metallopeptidase [Asticcacaulis sp.]
MATSAAWTHPVQPISLDQHQTRLKTLRENLAARNIGGLLLGATSSLRYFTGLSWYPSERLVAALITPQQLTYICPRFELEKLEGLPILPGQFACWEEHENPHALVAQSLPSGRLALDPYLPVMTYHGLATEMGHARLIDGAALITAQRGRKSAQELALMQYAKTLTLEVHRRVHAMAEPGLRASDLVAYIDQQHRALGADNGSTFCIVSFGTDTALPHGGEGDPVLRQGDLVLIDTGCRIGGYHSDITRTWVLGEPTADMRRVFALEQAAQAAAFAAAQPGRPCESVDAAARHVLEAAGLGPDYALPGLPHRTGHGIGLDIHEGPYLVRGDTTPLDTGMCFSNEPMIVLPGQFGIRLEDHFYMTPTGPQWFTAPQPCLVEPFKGVAIREDPRRQPA